MSRDDDYSDYNTSSRQSYGNSRGSGSKGSAKDMGAELKENICVGDDGKLQVFGKTFDLGSKEAAFFAAPIVNLALTNASLYGAKYAGKAGTSVASVVLKEPHHAAAVGKKFYQAWLYGLPLLDVTLGVKKTVQEGVKDLHDLQKQAQPLLSASDHKHVGIGQALTSNYTVLAHARAKAWKHFRQNLIGTVAGTVRALPAIFMGYNQAKLDEIINPRASLSLTKEPKTIDEYKELYKNKLEPLRQKQMPNGELEKIRASMKAVVEERALPKKPEDLMAKAKQLRQEVEEARVYFEQNPLPKSGYSSYNSPQQQQQREMDLKLTQADLYEAKANLPPEYGKLLGGLETTAEQRARQMEGIRQLQEIDGRPMKTSTDKQTREVIIKNLKKIRDDQIREMKSALNTIDAPRKAHLKDLKSLGGGKSTHGHEQHNPVLEMFNWLGDDEARERMFHGKRHNNHGIDYKKNIQNLQAMPAVATVVGDIVKRKVSNKDLPDTAWDKIMKFQEYLDRHRRPDRDQVAVDVKEIFQQHAKDLGLKYNLSGSGYEAAMEAITDAMVEQKLHPQALANILDDKRIVAFGRDDADFGDLKDVKQELESLVARYSKVNDKEVFKEIRPEDVVRIFNDIPPEEKPFFTMLWPPGALEKAGVPKAEVAKYRAEGTQNFVEDLADRMRLLIGAGHDGMHKWGVKGKYINAIETLEKGFRTADKDGEASDFIRDNLKDTIKAVRNVETSAKKPGEMWKDFVARGQSPQEEQGASKTPMDHAARESGEEMHMGG